MWSSCEARNDLLGFCGVQDQIIAQTPLNQMFDLLSVVCLLTVGYYTHYSGVITKFHYSVGVEGGSVMGEEREEGWTNTQPSIAPCSR